MRTVEIPDITKLYNVSSNAVKSQLGIGTDAVSKDDIYSKRSNNMFEIAMNAAVDNLNTTNDYLSKEENEELKLAMGLTDSTHDLTIAMQKAETALQYTVAVRDKLLDAYKEIMQMQI